MIAISHSKTLGIKGIIKCVERFPDELQKSTMTLKIP